MTNTLFIFATDKDISVPLIYEEAQKASIKCHVVNYKHFKIPKINYNDRIIIRWPWDASDTSIEYNSAVKKLVDEFYNQIVFDKECLKKYTPDYEDKLFQSNFFNQHAIPSPHTFHIANINNLPSKVTFPLVLKKRISSRSKNNFLINNEKELIEKLTNIKVEDYILQQAIDALFDYRVMVLNDKVIGTVNRFIHVRKNNRLSVKGMKPVTNLSPEIEKDALKLTKNLKADFVGCDVLIDKKGKHYFIEANLSPQFNVFTKTTGINVAKLLIEVTTLVL